MSVPDITVLMTVRNGEPHLNEAVESILDQSYEQFRFLILDNASTDNSREEIKAFNDSRIDLIELSEDIGQTAALNRGLGMIDTPWVARMDADDVSLPKRLELQMDYLAKHPDVALLGTAVTWIDGQGEVIRKSSSVTDDLDIRWGLLLGIGGVAHSSAIFSTTTAKSVGGYPPKYKFAQDFALWNLLVRGNRVENLSSSLVKIRIHERNITQPQLTELEVRTNMTENLGRLVPELDNHSLDDLVRALRYDPQATASQGMLILLKQLPGKFEESEDALLSVTSRRAYVKHWLHMAVLNNFNQSFLIPWLKLAIALDPSVIFRPEMWKTAVTLCLQFVRSRRRNKCSSAIKNAKQRF